MSNALPSIIPCICQAQDPQECPSPFFEPSWYYQDFEQEFETFCTFPEKEIQKSDGILEHKHLHLTVLKQKLKSEKCILK